MALIRGEVIVFQPEVDAVSSALRVVPSPCGLLVGVRVWVLGLLDVHWGCYLVVLEVPLAGLCGG